MSTNVQDVGEARVDPTQIKEGHMQLKQLPHDLHPKLRTLQDADFDWQGLCDRHSDVIVLVILSTQCQESIDSLDHLSYLVDEFPEKMVLLGITEEADCDALRQFVREHESQMKFQLLMDPSGDLCNRLRNVCEVSWKTPLALVIQKDGRTIDWFGKPRKPGLETSLRQVVGVAHEPSRPSGHPSTWPVEILSHMSVQELKAILRENGVEKIQGITEKRELIDEIRHLKAR